MQGNIIEILSQNQLVPVVTFTSGDDPSAFMDYLISLGVHCIEVTLRTPEGIEAIKALKKSHADNAVIGAGTVINAEQVSMLKEAGADFLVSPGFTPSLIYKMSESEIPFIPGAATPSEVMHAKELGLKALKFFPAYLYGGIDALKNFGQLFPDLMFCPTGGITSETSSDYLALKNVVAVGGSWFQKEYQERRT